MINMRDIYWLAGLLEGEGCFSTCGEKNSSMSIFIKMTDEDIIERAAAILGTKVNKLKKIYGPDRKKEYKPQYSTRLGVQHRVAGWLMTIYPLMGKRRQKRIRELLERWKKSSYIPPEGIRTMCKSGHPWTKETVKKFKGKQTGQCRICLAIKNREAYRRANPVVKIQRVGKYEEYMPEHLKREEEI